MNANMKKSGNAVLTVITDNYDPEDTICNPLISNLFKALYTLMSEVCEYDVYNDDDGKIEQFVIDNIGIIDFVQLVKWYDAMRLVQEYIPE
jgi:hypothetical protein